MPRILLFICLFSFYLLPAQELIKLKNPSFEDKAAPSTVPTDWADCQFEGNTPVDIMPGSFGVSYPAKHGATYLGIVVRNGKTWEGVSQELSSSMKAGKSYLFSAYLCRSVNYISYNIEASGTINFNYPIKLQIWGSNSPCEEQELLAETKLINNTEWLEYTFKLKPKAEYNYIKLLANPEVKGNYSASGNVLVDYCSAIREVGAEEEDRSEVHETMPNIASLDREALNSYFLYEIDQSLIDALRAGIIPKSPQLARIFRLRRLTYQGFPFVVSLSDTERQKLFIDLKTINQIRLVNLIKSQLALQEKQEEGKMSKKGEKRLEMLDESIKSDIVKGEIELYLWSNKALIKKELDGN